MDAATPTVLPWAERVETVLTFWYGTEPTPTPETKARWFRRSDQFDAQIRAELGNDYERAIAGELSAWESDPRAVIALVILIDQLSRNLHRDDPRAWANDPMALAITRRAMDSGMDQSMPPHHRASLYMPLMHAEDAAAQADCVAAFEGLASDCEGAQREGYLQNVKYALRHQEIVDRFGRFPHRNLVIGRTSTRAEIEFLMEPNSSF